MRIRSGRQARARQLFRVIALIVVCGAVLTGCGEDTEGYEPAIGTNARTPSTEALSFAIVVDGEGHGRVVGDLLNTTGRPTRLVDASVVAEAQPVRVSLPDGPITLPPGELVSLAQSAAISVSSPTPEDLPAGMFVGLTLRIRGSEPIELLVPVEPQEGPYADIEVTSPPDGDVAPE